MYEKQEMEIVVFDGEYVFADKTEGSSSWEPWSIKPNRSDS